MRCPKCGGKTKVLDTRKLSDKVIRRRACKDCGGQFRTSEVRARIEWVPVSSLT